MGKSCLIKRYCENKFVARYISTIGVDYGVKPVALGGREVRVNFFDLAGLDVYKDIRVEFFKDCHGAALIFSLADRPSFEHLDAWWKEAQEKGCAAHAWVLVGNKVREVEGGREREGRASDEKRRRCLHLLSHTGALLSLAV